jgi:hypothetical protein
MKYSTDTAQLRYSTDFYGFSRSNIYSVKYLPGQKP